MNWYTTYMYKCCAQSCTLMILTVVYIKNKSGMRLYTQHIRFIIPSRNRFFFHIWTILYPNNETNKNELLFYILFHRWAYIMLTALYRIFDWNEMHLMDFFVFLTLSFFSFLFCALVQRCSERHRTCLRFFLWIFFFWFLHFDEWASNNSNNGTVKNWKAP